MKRKTAKWALADRDVRFTRTVPKPEAFTADAYECSNCHNQVNNREPLPDICPGCKAYMSGAKMNGGEEK